ncbi:hypothetical protein IU486_01210 [Streptomyces gardneri]|nr:hypothetical protein [Streptomyces gardneri]
MITGVSLMPVDATLVVLQRVGGNYLPITLGIAGTYDRLGGIDGVREDLDTELVVRYFLDRYRDGRFFAKDQTSTFDGDALTSDSHIEELLQLIERTHLAIEYDNIPASTVLDGDMVVFALIAQPVWDAIVDRAPVPDRSPERQAERVFGPASTAAEIYEGRLPELATSLGQLAAVNDSVEAHGLRWAPAPEPSQRYPDGYGYQHGDEIKEFLDRAKRDYRDDPVISAGLAAYEQSIDWVVEELDRQVDDHAVAPQPTSATAADLLEVPVHKPIQYAVRIHRDEPDQP